MAEIFYRSKFSITFVSFLYFQKVVNCAAVFKCFFYDNISHVDIWIIYISFYFLEIWQINKISTWLINRLSFLDAQRFSRFVQNGAWDCWKFNPRAFKEIWCCYNKIFGLSERIIFMPACLVVHVSSLYK